MKKISMVLTGMFILLSIITSQAQDKEGGFFVGKWKVLVEGTPNGDSYMIVEFTRNDEGKLVGSSSDEKGENPATTFTRIDAKGETITAYWVAQGYDVYLFLEKINDDEVEGSLMDMFDATGKRIVEE